MRARARIGAFTFVEVLVAVMILAIVATSAVATWSISSRAPANKRVTDIGAIVAIHEIELVKAKKYANVQDTITPQVSWYDKYGGYISTGGNSGPNGSVYKASTTIRVVVDRDTKTNIEDLREVEVIVSNTTGTLKIYETQRTLMTFLGF